MNTIQTKAGNIILVEVPEDASRFMVSEPNTSFKVRYDLLFEMGTKWVAINNIMPTNDNGKILEKPIIIGKLTKGIPDFEVEQFVENMPMNADKFYRRYDATKRVMKFQDGDSIESGESWCGVINGKKFTANDSFISILKSHKIDLSKKYVVLKTKRC